MPDDARVVVERPDLYKVRLNGKEVAAEPGAWWLDRAFGKIECADGGAGRRERPRARGLALHDLPRDRGRLRDRRVRRRRPAESGFAIVPDRHLAAGWWKEQALPLYGGGVAYRAGRSTVAGPSGRYVVRLPAVERQRGQGAGERATSPGTSRPRPTSARSVTHLVAGQEHGRGRRRSARSRTRSGRTTRGPGLGSAWPGMFHQAPEKGPPPGSAYATVGYGLVRAVRPRAGGMRAAGARGRRTTGRGGGPSGGASWSSPRRPNI